MDIDWRAHQRWVMLDGQAVNTIELDARPPGAHQPDSQPLDSQPVVFVHGLAGSWPNWLEQLPVLGAERRVIAMDLPGFGHSPLPAGEISISGYARLLDRLLGELGIHAAAVVGSSMGGFIAAELAIAFPQRVERLVLVNAAGLSTGGRRARRALATVRRIEGVSAVYATWLASDADAVARRRRTREANLGLLVRHPGRLPWPLAAELLRGAGTPGFIPAWQALAHYDFRERLPEIACPTLIVWGEDDRLVDVRDADAYASAIAGSRKVIFKDTGHLSMLERPDAFNALLKEFLEE